MRILLAILLLSACQAIAGVPHEAYRYRADLVRNARLFWGLAAPVATFAAQVHQESAWKPNARSKYAAGLAQFTPDTADWIGGMDAGLASGDVFNPAWALRALALYDRWLWDRIKASSDCDRMAMTLAAYNGGLGWINREKRAATSKGVDANLWFGAVALECLRARWACEENRAYPVRILLKHQPLYLAWGPGIACRS